MVRLITRTIPRVKQAALERGYGIRGRRGERGVVAAVFVRLRSMADDGRPQRAQLTVLGVYATTEVTPLVPQMVVSAKSP